MESKEEEEEFGTLVFTHLSHWRDNLRKSLDLIPKAEKGAYLEALRRCPNLVATESDPMCFLRNENFNCRAAAELIVLYWEERKKAFGESKAFLPLEQAISQEAADALSRKDAALAILPRDSDGRSVIGVNLAAASATSDSQSHRNVLRNASAKARVQIMFYLCLLLMRNPQSQKEGIVILCFMEALAFHQDAKLDFHLFRTVMPVRLHAIHLLCKNNSPENTNRNTSSTAEEIVPIVLQILSRMTEKMVYVHHCKTKAACAAKLLQFGFTKDRLPEYLGGSWKIIEIRRRKNKDNQSSALIIGDGEEETKTPSYDHYWSDTDKNTATDTTAVDHYPPEAPPSGVCWKGTTNRDSISKEEGTNTSGDSLSVSTADLVQQAIQRIPNTEKGAYLEAMQRDPSLLETESHPLRFLIHDKYDVEAAAKRIVRFWEERKKAFGDEKAFLPLTYESYSEEATLALWEGAYHILPNDKAGRTVVYRDEKRIASLSLQTRLQLLFFLDYTAKSNPSCSEEGIVVITIMGCISFDRNSKVCLCASRDAMPTLVHSVHVFLRNGLEAHRDFSDNIALRLFGWLTDDKKTHIHACRTTEECATKLLPFGLEPNRLPAFMGGSSNFMQYFGGDCSVGEKYFAPPSIRISAKNHWRHKSQKYEYKNQKGKLSQGSAAAVVAHPPQTTNSRRRHSAPEKDPNLTTMPRSVEYDKSNRIETADSIATGPRTKLQKNALDRLQETIDLIPAHEKSAYLAALKYAPSHIFETEANLLWFLEYEKYDPWAAAKRIVAYWEERKKAFGDKAFLSLTSLLGENAYDDETMLALREGVYAVLPKDNAGRTVLYRKDSELRSLSLKARTQLTYYIYAMANPNPKSREEGIVVVSIVDEFKFNRNTNLTMHIGRLVMPSKIHSVHLFHRKGTSWGNEVVPMGLQLIRLATKYKMYMHEWVDPRDCAARLLPFGISKQGLPKELGGSWDDKQPDGGPKPENVNTGTTIVDNFAVNKEESSKTPATTIHLPQSSFLSTFRNLFNRQQVCLTNFAQPALHVRSEVRLDTEEAARKRQKRVNNLISAGASLSDQPTIAKVVTSSSLYSSGHTISAQLKSNSFMEPAFSEFPKPAKENYQPRSAVSDDVKPGECQPTMHDVLHGRGQGNIHNPGNRMLRLQVETYSHLYNSTRKSQEKTRIRKKVFDALRLEGRFLKYFHKLGKYYEVSDAAADEKIAQAFRNLRKK